jgi:hypothetical protein
LAKSRESEERRRTFSTSSTGADRDEAKTARSEHYVQYHNPDLIGTDVAYVAEHEPFAVGTNKRPGPVLGSWIWLIGGEGRPRRYSLCYRFIADRIAEDPDDQFRFTISGTAGHRFVPPLDLTDEPWFGPFLRFNANFSLGLRRIPEQYIPILESLKP